jgi:iron complex outermembrane receptor protein
MRDRKLESSPARWGGVALVWLLVGGMQQAVAEEPASASEAIVPEAVVLGEEVLLGEIVVKGKRGPRTESLEAREVRERGARDLGEALSSMPAIAKVRKGGVANDVVLRGMKKDDVAVTIDGAKVHGACPSRMDPPAFHLDYAEVDVVQVKRGPFDVAQAGGLAGAVDVRTRRGRPGLGTELNLEGGSASMMSGSLTTSYGAPGYDVLVGGSYKEGSPYLDGGGRNFTESVPERLETGAPNPARFRDTSDGQQAYRIASGFARVGFAPAAGQRLEVGYTRQSAPRALYPYLRMDGIADDTDRVTARWNAERLGPVAASVSGYWSRVAHDMTDVFRCSSAAIPGTCSDRLARDYSMGTFARSDVWGGQAEVRGGDPETLVGWKTGADLYVRSWDNRTERVLRPPAPAAGTYASEASIPDVRIVGAGLFAEARRTLGDAGGRTRLVAGVRLDAARSEAREDRTALYRRYYPAADLALSRGDVLVGGNVQLERDLPAGLTAWVGYGHGARVPDPQERYIALSGMGGATAVDWVGDPTLSPVQSDEVDLGLTWKAPGVVVKTQLFHAWYANYVDLANVTPAPGSAGAPRGRSYENVAARTFGGEATGRIALPLNLFVGGSASYTRGINDSTGASLAEIPPFKAALSLRWDDGRFFAEAEEIYAARQGFVDASLEEEPTPAWWTTSLKAGAGWRGVKVFAMVQNVFDRAYVEHLSYQRDPFAAGFKVPEPGRSFQLAAQYAY